MTLHTLISYVKSVVRIVAALLAIIFRHDPDPTFAIFLLALGLLVAEILGLVEELPGTYKGTETW
jgi:hypothetical protein